MPINLLNVLLTSLRSSLTALPLLPGYVYQSFTKANRYIAGISLAERSCLFSTYTPSQEEYLEVRSRIDSFISAVLSSQVAELSLTSNNLNSLRVTRGELDSKHKSFGKTQEFYEIVESGVIEKRFVHPFPTKYGFLDRALLISYENAKGSIFELRQVIEEYGKTIEKSDNALRKFSMKQSLPMFLILTKDKSAIERSNFVQVVESLREVSINGNKLYLKA